MSLAKRDISKNISSKTQISSKESLKFIDVFIALISRESKERCVKISRFGSFYSHTAPKRIGRNPKTKELFVIPKRSKICFKASKTIKNLIN